MFLRKLDYRVQIEADDLEVVTQGDDPTRVQAELSAQATVESYLSSRYDISKIFYDLTALLYDSSATYNIGEVVIDPDVATGTFYTPKADGLTGAGNDPTASPGLWDTIDDPRPELIKQHTIDLTLYHLHSARNPRNIPTLRMSRRDECVKWLEMVSQGRINASLPLLDPEAGQVIRWASNEKFNHSY